MLTIAGGILLAILILFLIPLALGIVWAVIFTLIAALQSVAMVWGLGPNEQKPITGRSHDRINH